MRRDYEDDSFDHGAYLDDEDGYLGEPSLRPGLEQHADTLKAGYPWIQHFLREHPGYEFVEFRPLPSLVEVPELMDARVALISTAGIYARHQKAFSVSPGEVEPEYLVRGFRQMGDVTFRSIPNDTGVTGLQVAYPNLDTSGAEDDINTIFPIIRLQQLEEENYIGSIAEAHISFMGYIPDPSQLDSEIGASVELLLEDGVSLALLSPADVLSHQTMAIIQRAVESAGIATISVALCRDVIERVGVPRAAHYRFPFGYSFGDSNDEATQLRILKEVLRACSEIKEPGMIVDLPYEWLEI